MSETVFLLALAIAATSELQERVDFTERLFAQNRDRIALPGEKRE